MVILMSLIINGYINIINVNGYINVIFWITLCSYSYNWRLIRRKYEQKSCEPNFTWQAVN